MNLQKAKQILSTQSPTGRKVSLLVAYVNERGPQSQVTLIELTQQRKPLRLALEMDYLVLTPDGKYSLGWHGLSVINWLLGAAPAPGNWSILEVKANGGRLLKRKKRGHA